MAQHVQLKIDAGIEVYFCDPRSTWQRPSNENTNGLLRQYFPKGTDPSRWSFQDISAVAAALNGRPRKVLGWRTLPRFTKPSYPPHHRLVLRGPLESAQYTAGDFRAACRRCRVRQSMGRTGSALDNAMIES